MKYDLHMHTNYSDGELTPEELVDKAIGKNLKGISITDHDTIYGVKKAINFAKEKDIEVIPGIEFGTRYLDDEVHILGYFFDYEADIILESVEQLFQWRKERGIRIIEKLADLENIKIDMEDVLSIAENGFVGRVPIALVLMKEGYVNTVGEAFDKYIGNNRSCYVEKETFSVQETIEIIKEAGGVSSLAHPILLGNKETMRYCVDMGIDAIECYHTDQTLEDSRKYIKFAKDNDLLITGGSDYHGDNKDDGDTLGRSYVYEEEILKLKELASRRK